MIEYEVVIQEVGKGTGVDEVGVFLVNMGICCVVTGAGFVPKLLGCVFSES